MTGLDALALFAIMITLAAVPSASVALVVTRAATGGFGSGACVAAGIVLADLLFVVLAVLGMTALAEVLGGLFVVLRYLGGAYLLWLGFSLLRSVCRGSIPVARDRWPKGLLTSFLAGFVLTLGDVKAILFYASLFPAFVDMTALAASDLALILLVTVVTVGGVKLVYAGAATRIALRLQRKGRVCRVLQPVAGGVMIVAGATVIANA
ncbi:MAG: LysE family translocator [Pseudomonadota bacterium]